MLTAERSENALTSLIVWMSKLIVRSSTVRRDTSTNKVDQATQHIRETVELALLSHPILTFTLSIHNNSINLCSQESEGHVYIGGTCNVQSNVRRSVDRRLSPASAASNKHHAPKSLVSRAYSRYTIQIPHALVPVSQSISQSVRQSIHHAHT